MGIREHYQGFRHDIEIVATLLGLKSNRPMPPELRAHLDELKRQRKEADQQSAAKLPESMQKFGGRVALVVAFDHPAKIANGIVRKLIDNGFDQTDVLTIDCSGPYHPRGTENLINGRLALRAAFKGLMPNLGQIDGEDDIEFTTEDFSLSDLRTRLEEVAEQRYSTRPEAKLGYVRYVDYPQMTRFMPGILPGDIMTPSQDDVSWHII